MLVIGILVYQALGFGFSCVIESFHKWLRSSSWEKKLVHVQYESNRVVSRSEYYHGSSYMLLNHVALTSNIVDVTLCTINLNYPLIDTLKLLKNGLKDYTEKLSHHFIIIRTVSGHQISLEKTRFWILLQSCPVNADDSKESAVTRLMDGKNRPKIKSLSKFEIIGKNKLRNVSVADFLNWVTDEACKKRYDVVTSNCQHFAQDCWRQLVYEPYPDPARGKRQYGKF